MHKYRKVVKKLHREFILIIYGAFFSVDLHDKKAEYKIIGNFTSENNCNRPDGGCEQFSTGTISLTLSLKNVS